MQNKGAKVSRQFFEERIPLRQGPKMSNLGIIRNICLLNNRERGFCEHHSLLVLTAVAATSCSNFHVFLNNASPSPFSGSSTFLAVAPFLQFLHPAGNCSSGQFTTFRKHSCILKNETFFVYSYILVNTVNTFRVPLTTKGEISTKQRMQFIKLLHIAIVHMENF